MTLLLFERLPFTMLSVLALLFQLPYLPVFWGRSSAAASATRLPRSSHLCRFPLPSLLNLDGKLGKMDRVLLAWVALFWLTAMAEGLQVTVPDKKKVAMLFQPTVLRCHFSTSSHQPAVVQWKFKSYCQDRMGESLGMSSPRAQSLSKRNLEWDPYLDCLDSRRTVRVVASKQGSTVTLGDFYRGREITIVHDADLQIGKLMWGDSGLYYCVITTPDDLEGKNEDSVELLVLEWVFVGLVILAVFLFFVLVGICWCQCCPHSCCCYIRCPCCPDSCCCPQALYEAGKAAKAGYPPSVSGVPGPYSIPSVPLGGAPSPGMLMDKPHPPPLAPSDSTGGSHSGKCRSRLPCPSLLPGFPLLIRTISSVMAPARLPFWFLADKNYQLSDASLDNDSPHSGDGPDIS
ncbi:hypothetical protein CB1_002523006 [Camelus ferus]|nr:hypothetical protein CB1_002523006 [Camelus ferus]